MDHLIRDCFQYCLYLLIAYVGTVNALYFLLMVLGYFALRHDHLSLDRTERAALLKSRLLPPVSVLAPAFNESATIRESVHAMLGLEYPRLEVIVINDGSQDDTLDILIREFKLYRSSRQLLGNLRTKPIRAVYKAPDHSLVVIDKENGGKADSLNAGLNAARTPFVAAVDSDSLLEQDALYYVAAPFLRDENVVAAGGLIRVVNGCDVKHGRVCSVRVPRPMLARFQVVEYFRAFLGGRIAFSLINSLMLISGAFGLFRRDAVLEVGGFRTSTVGEDMEMLFNPRYGSVGMFGFPYFFAVELIGPFVELLGYPLTIAGLATGVVSWQSALLFFVVSVLFGILLSMSAVLLEEFTLRRYPSLQDVFRLFWAAFAENFGFRQLLTLWRVEGLIDGVRRKQGWGAMERKGFQGSS